MKIKKALTCILCASLVCGSLAACGDGLDSEIKDEIVAEENEAIVTEVVNKVANTGSSDAKKEETVYVKTTANGAVDTITVSNWLKNTENTEELSDETTLTDIKNVKGKETYTEDNGVLTWDSEGSDIYYQGTTDKELPIDVNITYSLDGREISPEDLAGQSGHVVITMNYTNKSTQTVEINGEEETIYTPFVVVSGMIVDQEKFTNVTVSNGTIVSDGLRNVVVGMAFPGLVDSLNGGKVEDSELLDEIEEKVEIPSQVVVEADVTDFELGMTLTMVSSDVAGALGLDDLDLGTDSVSDDLKSQMDEFSDAGTQLVDGTQDLKDGAAQLQDGTKDLVSGTGDLYDGIVAYTNGVGQVAAGASELDAGAGQLDAGAGELLSGIGQVSTGAGQVASGASQVSGGVDTLCDQMTAIATGVGTAASAASQISGGIDQLAAATNVTTYDASSISVTGAMSSEQIAATASTIASYTVAGLQANGITDETTLNAVSSAVTNAASGVLPTVTDQVATGAAQQATSTAVVSTMARIHAAIVNPTTEGGTSLQAGASQLASSLASSYSQLTASDAQTQIAALKQGASDLASGASELSSGLSQVSAGASTLKEGTSSLKAGTSALVSGTSELTANSQALVDGAKTLSEGSVTLVDGINQLYDGTVELNDGMIKFNEEGITKLTDIFNTDLVSMTDRIKAISDAGKAYTTYSGSKADEDCSVKFIIESAEIKK